MINLIFVRLDHVRPQASRVDGGPGTVRAIVVLHGMLVRVSFRHVSLHFSSAVELLVAGGTRVDGGNYLNIIDRIV